MAQEGDSLTQGHRTLSDTGRAKRIKIFRNGDTNFVGKDFTVNRKQVRTFPAFLQNVTTGLRTINAVRKICTPRNGTTITSLDQLNDHDSYVAVDGRRFKPCRYLDLEKEIQAKHKASPHRIEVKPVVHSKRYRQLSARFPKIPTDALQIFVFANGKDNQRARKIVLTHHMMDQLDWTSILNLITARVDLDNGACRKVYTLEGQQITDKTQFQNGETYVATGKEHLKKLDYGHMHKPDFQVSPRYRDKSLEHGDKQKSSGGHNMHARTTRTSGATKTPSGSTDKTQSSYYSTESSKSSKKNRHNQSDFNARESRKPPPSQIRSSPNKRGPEVFKAKHGHRETQGASTVDDTKETKTEVPVDQKPAEIVQEEFEYETTTSREREEPKSTTSHDWVVGDEKPVVVRKVSGTRSITKDTSNLSAYGAEDRQQQTVASRSDVREERQQTPKEEDYTKKHEDAAVKIQANYRGYRARKEVKARKQYVAQSYTANQTEKDPNLQANQVQDKPYQQDNQVQDEPYQQANPVEEPPTQTNEIQDEPYQQTSSLVKEELYAQSNQVEDEPYIQTSWENEEPDVQTTYREETRPSSQTEELPAQTSQVSDEVNTQADQSDEKEQKAAVAIQANFRGYKARKELKATTRSDQAVAEQVEQQDDKYDQTEEKLDNQKPDDSQNEKEHQAATTIQAGYRGYRARKQVTALKASS